MNKELPATNPESDSKEFIYQAKKPEDYDSDEEIKGDDIEESDTLIPLEATLVITEFIDVVPKDNTPILSDVIPVITEFVDIFLENLSDKLPPMRDIQHVIDLVS